MSLPMSISRITLDPNICHGKPCVRGLRYPVTFVLDLLGSGMSPVEILSDYPDLESDDIQACLQFAARLSDFKSVARATA
ncbi:MAG: DUF433 domain-containing protein [Planctomycetota bacterium]|nr:DUF433 domain-containing protein [Planctomycetota bacterium]